MIKSIAESILKNATVPQKRNDRVQDEVTPDTEAFPTSSSSFNVTDQEKPSIIQEQQNIDRGITPRDSEGWREMGHGAMSLVKKTAPGLADTAAVMGIPGAESASRRYRDEASVDRYSRMPNSIGGKILYGGTEGVLAILVLSFVILLIRKCFSRSVGTRPVGRA